jgi:hypothetical protein
LIGCGGWGYFTENQNQWGSVLIKMDRIEYAKCVRMDGQPGNFDNIFRTDGQPWDVWERAMSPEKRVEYGVKVRMRFVDLRVLADVEALVDEVIEPPLEETPPPRLK